MDNKKQIDAYRLLYDDNDRVLFQADVDTPPQIDKAPGNHTEQYIVLNPISEGATARKIVNFNTIQSFTIEQDCISKQLQREWFNKVFPKGPTVAVDSGNKSIHHHIRISAKITPEQHTVLTKALEKAFPFCDTSVISDISKLVRNPGAVRSNKQLQEILYLGSRYSFHEILGLLFECTTDVIDINLVPARKILKKLYKKDTISDKKITEALAELIAAGHGLAKDGMIYKAFLENFGKNRRSADDLDAMLESAQADAKKKNLKASKSSKSAKQENRDRKFKLKNEVTNDLSQVDLLGIMEGYYTLDAREYGGSNTRVICPFHEDKVHSAWISKNPTDGIERFFCSVDTCGYHSAATHGVTAIDFLRMNENLSYRQAIEKLIGKTLDKDFYYRVTDMDEEEIEKSKAQVAIIVPQINLFDDSGVDAKHSSQILNVLESDWGTRAILIQAPQAAGKSHAISHHAVNRLSKGLSTVVFSRCHAELDQIEKRILGVLINSGIGSDYVFHLRGVSGGSVGVGECVADDSSPREFPSVRPIIILAPHCYLNRKDDSLYTFEIVKMIAENEFGKNTRVIIDETPSFIESRTRSTPMGARYCAKVVRGYRKWFRISKCQLGNGTGDCRNCKQKLGFTSRGVRGSSIEFVPQGQHDYNNTSTELMTVDLNSYIANESVLEDKTMLITCIYGEKYDELKKGVNEIRKIMTGSKEELDAGVGTETVTPQKFFEDVISHLYFPHIIQSYPYNVEEESNSRRCLTEEELTIRKEDPKAFGVPKQTCGIPTLQGLCYLALKQLGKHTEIAFLGPDESQSNKNFLNYVYQDDITEWSAPETFAPLEQVLILSYNSDLPYNRRSIKRFMSTIRKLSPGNSGILSFFPNKRDALAAHKNIQNTLVSTFYDGEEHRTYKTPGKASIDDHYTSYSHGPIGAGVDLSWFKTMLCSTNVPLPKAAISTEYLMSTSDPVTTFKTLVLNGKIHTIKQNIGRIMRIDMDFPEEDVKVRRLIILHGPDSETIGKAASEYFASVKHKVLHRHCENSIEFLKEMAITYRRGNDITALASKGPTYFENNVLLENAITDIETRMKDDPTLRWRDISIAYSIKRLSTKQKKELMDWFNSARQFGKKQHKEQNENDTIAGIRMYFSENPTATYSEIISLFKLKNKTSKKLQHAIKKIVKK